MITKAQIQFIRSLEQRRNREESGCFIVEGDKLVREAMELPRSSRFKITVTCGTEQWLRSSKILHNHPDFEVVTVSPRELERISFLKTPNQALAVISTDYSYLPDFDFEKDLLIGLSEIQDPGNVGTIIRIADWFGIDGIIASPNSADFYSPKVVQSSMGSIFRVKLLTTDLFEFTESLPGGFPIYGTHLEGKNLYSEKLKNKGIILLGNESRGLDDDLSALCTERLLIPDFSNGVSKPESLNVSIAAAIVCSEFRRRGNS